MKRFPFPLRITIPCLLFLLGGLSGALSFQQQVSLSNRRVEERLTWQGQFMGSRTSSLLEYVFRRAETVDRGTEGANIIISQMAGDPDLRLAVLVDDTNRIAESTQALLKYKNVANAPFADQLSVLERVRQTIKGEVIWSNDRKVLWAVYPFYLQRKAGELRPSRVGILILQYDSSRQKRQAYSDAWVRSLYTISGLMGLCVVIWLWFEYVLTRRASRLVTVSDRLAGGELDARIELGGSDELSQIANAFDTMAERIQHDTDALRQSEKQLREQTQQLELTLVKLQETQTQLTQTEKMSSLGQLVAGVAHEINNPVNFIHGNLTYASDYAQDLLRLISLYQRHYPTPAPAILEELDNIDLDFLVEDFTKILHSMRVGTDRIRAIVLSLRNFSRLDEAEMKPVNIHEGIESTLLILQNRLKAKRITVLNTECSRPEIQVVKTYGPLPLVNCYAGQLNQVFMNILANAIDALEDFIVRKHRSQLESGSNPSPLSDYLPKIYIQTILLENQRVLIKIADNGPGMPEEVQQRIFDPFFTTKPVGQGTGLGLSISYQIVVEKHGGALYCNAQPCQGTEFGIEIPVSLPEPELPKRPERVLSV